MVLCANRSALLCACVAVAAIADVLLICIESSSFLIELLFFRPSHALVPWSGPVRYGAGGRSVLNLLNLRGSSGEVRVGGGSLRNAVLNGQTGLVGSGAAAGPRANERSGLSRNLRVNLR